MSSDHSSPTAQPDGTNEARFWSWLGTIQLLIAAGAIVTEASSHPEAVAIGATGVLALGVAAGSWWHAGRLRAAGGESA